MYFYCKKKIVICDVIIIIGVNQLKFWGKEYALSKPRTRVSLVGIINIPNYAAWICIILLKFVVSTEFIGHE